MASTCNMSSFPKRSRTASTGSRSQPGWIFSFTRRYPASRYSLTESRSCPIEFMMPTATPAVIESVAPPKNLLKEMCSARSCASSTAISKAALAMR